MNVGDKVIVTFTDGHTQVGTLVSIEPTGEYRYCVAVKLWGEDTEVYCTENDIRKAD